MARVGSRLGWLLLLSLPSLASAHAPPQVLDIVWHADGRAVLVTNRGLILVGADPRQARLVCNEALPFNSTEKPNLLIMPDGDLVISTARGLLRSSDGGCSFAGVDVFAGVNVPAAVADPRDAAHFYVAAFDPERGGLYETSDAGDSFETLVGPSEHDFVEALLIPPSRPERLYVSGEMFDAQASTRYVAHSDDGGASFVRFPVPLLPSEGVFELLAVSPRDPDLLLGRAADRDAEALQDRLLVSHDRGESWDSPITVRALTGARFAADGEAWVTGVEGAFRSADDARNFEPLPLATRISLALPHDDRVWLCGYYDGEHDGVAQLDAAGNTAPHLAFSDVDEQAECPESTPAIAACGAPWRDWEREILGVLPDASVPQPTADAAAPEPDAGTGAADAEGDSCTCRVPGRPRREPTATLALLGVLGLARWMRRARIWR